MVHNIIKLVRRIIMDNKYRITVGGRVVAEYYAFNLRAAITKYILDTKSNCYGETITATLISRGVGVIINRGKRHV